MNREKDTFAFREYAVIFFFMLITCICLLESWRILQEQMQVNSPGLLPMVLSVVMACCILISLLHVKPQLPEDRIPYKKKTKLVVDSIREEFPLNVAGTVGITLFYLFSLNYILYVPATILYMFLCMLFLGRNKRKAKNLIIYVTIAIGITAFVYIVFKMLFLVTLP